VHGGFGRAGFFHGGIQGEERESEREREREREKEREREREVKVRMWEVGNYGWNLWNGGL